MKQIFVILGILLLLPALVLGAVMIISNQPISEDSAQTQFVLGNAHYLNGEYVAAAVSFEKAVAVNQNYEEALKNLALTYNKLGRYAEAANVLRLLTISHELNAEYHYDLGINIAMTLQKDNKGSIEEVEEAILHFQKSDELRPGIDHAKENIAFLEDLRGQYYSKQ